MNKKQKIVVLVSILLFLFVTLNPSVFRLSPRDIFGSKGGIHYESRNYRSPYFTIRPMYQYWAVIAVPTVALYYHFKDKKDKKAKDEQKQ